MKYHLLVLLCIALIPVAGITAGTAEPDKGAASVQKAETLVSAPSDLHLRIVPNGFQLDWKLSPQDPGGVTGYEVVRADRFTGPYDPVATVGKGVSQCIDATAVHEIIYFYKVRAMAGSASSPYSNTVTGER